MLLAMMMPGAAAQDLRVTPHNLARQGSAAAAAESEAGELCVFCHAPTAEAASGPRWQRALEASYAFSMYDEIGGGLAGRIGSHSVVCLSCHDGLQAPNAGLPRGVTLTTERDHPFGVPYRGALDGRPDPRAEYRPAMSGILDGKPAWWVSRAVGATRVRGDLPLFPRHQADGADPVPLIECGTCHDPHNTAPLFLRLAGRGSLLCLTCHNM